MHIAVYIGCAINGRIRRCEAGGSTARATPGGGGGLGHAPDAAHDVNNRSYACTEGIKLSRSAKAATEEVSERFYRI